MKKLNRSNNLVNNTIEVYTADANYTTGCECGCKCNCQGSSSKVSSTAKSKDKKSTLNK